MRRQKSYQSNLPTLYLVATPIGNLEEFTPRAIEVLKSVDVIAAEDTRTSQPLLRHFDIKTKLIAHHLFNEKNSTEGLIDLLQKGMSVALISDAGYPLISDPGQLLVNRVIEEGFQVVTVNGPSAILSALVASGITAQPFTFVGFLNSSDKERKKELNKWKLHEETLIIYEAPHRIKKTLIDILDIFGDRKMCLARELTKKYEEYLRGTVSEIIEEVDDCKGEMVLVISGYVNDNQPVLSVNEIISIVDSYVSSGMSTSQAIKKAAQENGISKNELYKSYFN